MRSRVFCLFLAGALFLSSSAFASNAIMRTIVTVMTEQGGVWKPSANSVSTFGEPAVLDANNGTLSANNSTDSGSSNAGKIGGGVAGGIAFVFIVMMLCWCALTSKSSGTSAAAGCGAGCLIGSALSRR